TSPARHGDGDDAGSGFAMMRKTARQRAVAARRGSAANSSRVAASAGLQEHGQSHGSAFSASAASIQRRWRE
ncbi:hypothetical protein Dimus_016370, partial [Dionaea muscipula]